jgi:hypothetical protein
VPAKMRLGQSPESLPKVGERPFQGWALAVSDDGQTIIGEVSGQPVRWSSSGNTVFERIVTGPNPRDPVISPYRLVDVSADGSTVVGNAGVSWIDINGDVQSSFLPFYWTEARGLRLLESPWPDETHDISAAAVSGDGKSILCSHSDPANHSNITYLWSGARVFNLGGYNPVGMSDDGKTVLLAGMSGSYVWREGLGTIPVEDFLNVDLTGWSLPGSSPGHPLYAERISSNGKYLVGHAVFNGENTTWLATVAVPEPSTLVLGVVGVLGVAAGWWRNRRQPVFACARSVERIDRFRQ